jgi:CelD/BcsL family acetyltransferase involved in cellulose biosynthesis
VTTFEVRIHASMASIAHEWDELADRVEASPFVRRGWFEAWWRAFGVGRLEIVAVRKNGRLCAALPLTARRGVHEPPANEHTVQVALLAEDEQGAAALASAVLARRPVRRLTLRWATEERCGIAAISNVAAKNRYRVVVGPSQRSPYLWLNGDWASYEARLPNHFRKALRRRRRRLAERGAVTVEIHDGRERLGELLAEGFRLEASGWKGEARTAITSRPETHQFYVDAARWAAERGILRLAFLKSAERAVAFRYALEDNGAFYNIKSGYDPAFSKFAPGRLLLEELIRRAFDRGLHHFEFLGSDDPHKLEWTSTCHELVRLHAFAPTVPGQLEWAAFAYGWPLAKRTSAAAKQARVALNAQTRRRGSTDGRRALVR